jgi:spermidine/putrescine-binding protein
MNFDEFHTKSKSGGYSRRQINKMLASLGIASASMMGVSRSALAATPSVDLFTWAGYDSPEMFAEYTEKYGGPPEITRTSSNNEARAKVRGGFTPDFAVPSWSHGAFWIDEGLVEPLDISRLPRWSEMFERLQNLEEGDVKHFVPLAWGNTAVVYRTDMVPPDLLEDSSWGILWDERLKGQIAIRDAFMGAMLPAALWGGVGDAYDMTDEELDLVGDLLRTQRDLVRFYWKAEADVQQAMASGEIAVISGWNSTYATLKAQGVPVGFMVPKEGMPTWVDGYMMIKGGAAPEQEKYDFLHAAMSAEAGAHLIEEVGYGAANAKAFEVADAEKVASLGIGDVATVVERGLWSVAVPVETKDKMVDLYNRVKSGF